MLKSEFAPLCGWLECAMLIVCYIAIHSRVDWKSVRQGVKGERELVSAIVGSGERWLIWICHTAAIERFVILAILSV